MPHFVGIQADPLKERIAERYGVSRAMLYKLVGVVRLVTKLKGMFGQFKPRHYL